uniref:(northern house mosquito) hypothetical protein n=1 Tax=Culex pipiens TaxID=7175 RepID=A0A8D8FE42_CULPI
MVRNWSPRGPRGECGVWYEYHDVWARWRFARCRPFPGTAARSRCSGDWPKSPTTGQGRHRLRPHRHWETVGSDDLRWGPTDVATPAVSSVAFRSWDLPVEIRSHCRKRSASKVMKG